jgi:hypothetical protein
MLVPPEDNASARRVSVRLLIIANAAILLGGLVVIWATDMFGSDIDWQGWIAVSLALLLASGLGTGLMALAFFSSRTERDQAVYDVERERPEERDKQSDR